MLKETGRLWISIPVLDDLPFEHGRDIVLGHGHLVPYTTESIRKMLTLASFEDCIRINHTPYIFGHWKVIGREKDNLESSRWLAIK
jgi:hypothetical protein